MKKATKEEIFKLKKGQPIIVDVDNKISTIAIFVEYNDATKKIVCIDSTIAGKEEVHHWNIAEYDDCFIPNVEQAVNSVLNIRS